MSDYPHELQKIFSSEPEIKAVYLFGSRATGKIKKDSDFDLALVTDNPEYFSKNKLKLLTQLAKAGIEKVDLVEINTKDLLLAFEAVKHNKLVYAQNNFDKSDFYSKTLRMYFDFQYALKIQMESQKMRLLSI